MPVAARAAAALAALGAAVLAGGCAAPPKPTEHVVLLPSEDGRPGAVVVTRRDGTSTRLDQPFATASVSAAGITSGRADADTVRGRYATLLSVQPPAVRSYTLHFEFNRTVLTADSQRQVDRILVEAAVTPAAEIDVVGHTDSRGPQEYNDALGRQRAQHVATLMEARGFDRARLAVQSRGEREPLVPTPDDTDEPRNRRVEIRLR